MNLKEKYTEIIEQLKNNKKPQITLQKNEVKEIIEKWKSCCDEQVCLLDHCQSLHLEFTSLLIKTLGEDHGPDILVYALYCGQRHVIAKHHLEGLRVPHDYIMQLKKLLYHKNSEVVEWTLRTIDQLGGRSIMLKDDVIKIKPHFLQLFDSHKKASRQIIHMLEKRWQQ
jgi:hypothetical protein